MLGMGCDGTKWPWLAYHFWHWMCGCKMLNRTSVAVGCDAMRCDGAQLGRTRLVEQVEEGGGWSGSGGVHRQLSARSCDSV
jgi:hypothetical protein